MVSVDLKEKRLGVGIWPVVKIAYSYLRVPGFKSWLRSSSQLPANAHPWGQQVMAEVIESLPPVSETWIEFLAPSHWRVVGGVVMIQPQLLVDIWGVDQWMKMSLSVCLPLK